MSTGAIAGTTVSGVVALVLLVVLAVFCILRQRRRKQKLQSPDEAPSDSGDNQARSADIQQQHNNCATQTYSRGLPSPSQHSGGSLHEMPCEKFCIAELGTDGARSEKADDEQKSPIGI
jgi:flagellar biosynthesis/type III secretory pathway M-ring protein FliF/YscJ